MTEPGVDVVLAAYLALARDSLVPTDGRLLAAAALRAAARSPGVTAPRLPPGFGHDVERDGAWLSSVVPPEAAIAAATAMARETGLAHTGVSDEDFRAGLQALSTGEPRVAPGFALWRQEDGRSTVADVDTRGSAAASGLLPGDVLLAVDGEPLGPSVGALMPFYAAVPGTRLTLAVEREGRALDLAVVLTPGAVPSVTCERLEGGAGHLRVRWFAHSDDPERDTATLARRAIAGLAADGAPGVVLDLRGGMGGHPAAAAGIASAFCEGEVMAELAHDGRRVPIPRSGPLLWAGAAVAVLVNESTVSAGEYLALALEELGGAVIVGTPTAGGLNGMGFLDLGGGYKLATPKGEGLGPRSGVGRPGMRLEPAVSARNPTPEELRSGSDPALEAARRTLGA